MKSVVNKSWDVWRMLQCCFEYSGLTLVWHTTTSPQDDSGGQPAVYSEHREIKTQPLLVFENKENTK